MAKKTAKKSAATGKTAATKAAKKKSPAKKPAESLEIVLDSVEEKAFELAHASEKICKELSWPRQRQLPRPCAKVFKQHNVALTPAQGEKVALILFGD